MNPMPVFGALAYTRLSNRKRPVYVNGKLYNLISPSNSNEKVKVVLSESKGN